MAHKKAAGSAKNLKKSNPKYRGVKVFWGQTVRAGDIIIRQKGQQFVAGTNTYTGRDHTIHAKTPGIVAFKKKNIMRFDGRKYLKTVVMIQSEDQLNTSVTVSKATKKSDVTKSSETKPTKKDVGSKKVAEKKKVVKKTTSKVKASK
jgi:large subunit ribosomal protein L27